MKFNKILPSYETRTFTILAFLIFGLITSPALVSVSIGALFVNFLISINTLKSHLFDKSNFIILSACLFFIINLILFAFAPDYKLALEAIWHRLPWLLIPLSIAGIKNFKNQHIYLLLAFFTLIISVSGLIVLVNYLAHYDSFQEKIRMGKAIATPINHVRFSLMLAFTSICSIYFAIKNNTKLTPYDRIFFVSTSVFTFVLLHILAVRSGLVCFYIALLFLFLYFSYSFKKWWLFPSVICVVIALPIISYNTIDSFKSKIDYMKYDIEQFKNGTIGSNSDARRAKALEVSFELIDKYKLKGCGIGALPTTVIQQYKDKHPDIIESNQKLPHNQFLYTFLEMGVVGILVLLIVLFFPLLSTLWFKNPLYICFWLIITASLLVENTFEGQIGLCFYLIFASLLLKLKPNE